MKTNPIKLDFTIREYQIITLILQGKSTQEIADCLNLSVFTIKKHRENIARKLGSTGKAEFRKAIFQIHFIPNPILPQNIGEK